MKADDAHWRGGQPAKIGPDQFLRPERGSAVGMRLYVGNLPYDITDDELRDAFAGFGEVASATVINDKFSGRSRGFGFVEMSSPDDGRSAIESMNGSELKGRTLTVNEAQPRPDRGNRGDRGDRGRRDGRDDRGDRGDRGGRGRW